MVRVLTVADLSVKDTFWTVGIFMVEGPSQDGDRRRGAGAQRLRSFGHEGLELATATFLTINDSARAHEHFGAGCGRTELRGVEAGDVGVAGAGAGHVFHAAGLLSICQCEGMRPGDVGLGITQPPGADSEGGLAKRGEDVKRFLVTFPMTAGVDGLRGDSLWVGACWEAKVGS
jgi:hypothetical protein